MRYKLEKKKCEKCGKDFQLKWIYYPTKLDEKRKSYFVCPYCGNITNVHIIWKNLKNH